MKGPREKKETKEATKKGSSLVWKPVPFQFGIESCENKKRFVGGKKKRIGDNRRFKKLY